MYKVHFDMIVTQADHFVWKVLKTNKYACIVHNMHCIYDIYLIDSVFAI